MIEICEELPASLATYAEIASAFVVHEVLDVSELRGGPGGLLLARRMIETPYVKDYDAHAAHHPSRWGERFDVSRWCFLSGRLAGEIVARAAVAWDTPTADLFDGRHDMAVLWDLRVAPAAQRQGIGTALFRAAAECARARGARWLRVETQNVNVAACEFYASLGCMLGAIHRFAYAEFPHEAQLLWYRQLTQDNAVETRSAFDAK